MTGPVDVRVVGGGPAGLGFALAAARHGLRVAVHEKAGAPGIDKPCGEGLMPDGVQILRAWGVEPRGRPFRGIVWRAAAGATPSEAPRAAADFPGEPGLGIRRTELHRAMAAAAAEVAELRWGSNVRRVDPGDAGGDPSLETDRGREPARVVVVADGLRSRLRADLGLAGRAARQKRYGVRRHLALAPWEDRVEVRWGSGAETYVTPVADDEIGVAVLWSGRKAGFDALLADFPELSGRIEGAERRSSDRGAGPLAQRARRVRRGRTLLLGDAAGYLDAITGEGLALAFRQAEALAERIAANDVEGWDGVHRRLVRLPTLLIRLLLIAEARPALRRRLLEATSRDPGLFAALLRVHVGDEPVRPRLVFRLLGGLATA